MSEPADLPAGLSACGHPQVGRAQARAGSAGRIGILGAGLSGLSAAWKLAAAGVSDQVIVEQGEAVGGLARTMVTETGGRYDLGSHRIHVQFLDEPMAVVREVVGDELLVQPRHGRLRLNGRYIHYPPTLAAFLAGMGPRLVVSGSIAMLRERMPWNRLPKRARGAGPVGQGPELSYEDLLTHKAGRVVYKVFYEPYAWKVYGISPRQVSADAAKVRVTHTSVWEVARSFLRNRARKPAFYIYPRRGIGTISERLAAAAVSAGAELATGTQVRHIRLAGGRFTLETQAPSGARTIEADTLITSLPINVLCEIFEPPPPVSVLEAARALTWRSLRLVYLELDSTIGSVAETYYFPEGRFVFGRISRPQLFSPEMGPKDAAGALCLEVPCSVGDDLWSMSDDEIAARFCPDLEDLGFIQGRQNIQRVFSRHLPRVYPIYDLGWYRRFQAVCGWLRQHDRVFLVGRGGLFNHNNMDHTMQGGLRAAEHLLAGRFADRDWYDLIDRHRTFRVRD